MSFAHRTPFDWKLRTRQLSLGAKTLVMGVLNVTPDSFSDGGRFDNRDRAIEQALRMFAEGATIVDIGGESTRPGKYQRVSAQEELDRVLPVIEGILQQRPDSILSIDTYKAESARAAILAGAEIVNDVSGLLWDEVLGETCAELQCGVILMHTRGRPEEWRSLPHLASAEVVPLVKRELSDRLAAALHAGIAGSHVALDPGFGFGKAYDSNYPVLAHLEELRALGQPLLAGVSRKSFLGRTLTPLFGTEAPVDARENATLAATTAAILAGADMVRVHEVRPAVEAALIADAILAAN